MITYNAVCLMGAHEPLINDVFPKVTGIALVKTNVLYDVVIEDLTTSVSNRDVKNYFSPICD